MYPNNPDEIDAIEKAVAILRRYADSREIPENDAGRISHYAMLHSQEKGISQEAAFAEIVRIFRTGSWSDAPEPPQTEIQSHLIAIVTDPIPEVGKQSTNGVAKITAEDYIRYLHETVRSALAHNGFGHLSPKVSVHPVEIRTDRAGTSDYLHVVELAADPATMTQITQLWPDPSCDFVHRSHSA